MRDTPKIGAIATSKAGHSQGTEDQDHCDGDNPSSDVSPERSVHTSPPAGQVRLIGLLLPYGLSHKVFDPVFAKPMHPTGASSVQAANRRVATDGSLSGEACHGMMYPFSITT
jgi:hypothetical protein